MKREKGIIIIINERTTASTAKSRKRDGNQKQEIRERETMIKRTEERDGERVREKESERRKNASFSLSLSNDEG